MTDNTLANGLEIVGYIPGRALPDMGGRETTWVAMWNKPTTLYPIPVVLLTSAQAAVAKEHTSVLLAANEKCKKAVSQIVRLEQRITALETTLGVAREALAGASSAVAKSYCRDDYQEHVDAIALIDTALGEKTQ